MMSPPAVANRSFLHQRGDSASDLRKKSLPNLNHGQEGKNSDDKIVYATLDSLALRRTTLPLCLVPLDRKVSSDDELARKNGINLPKKCEQDNGAADNNNHHFVVTVESKEIILVPQRAQNNNAAQGNKKRPSFKVGMRGYQEMCVIKV